MSTADFLNQDFGEESEEDFNPEPEIDSDDEGDAKPQADVDEDDDEPAQLTKSSRQPSTEVKEDVEDDEGGEEQDEEDDEEDEEEEDEDEDDEDDDVEVRIPYLYGAKGMLTVCRASPRASADESRGATSSSM